MKQREVRFPNPDFSPHFKNTCSAWIIFYVSVFWEKNEEREGVVQEQNSFAYGDGQR